jgi:hypothetical protein
VQEGKLAHASFPPWWNDVVRDALVLVLMQKGKIACASFLPWWNDVVQDALVLVQEGKLARVSFPHGGMMLFEMIACACAGGKTSTC